ncbi:MAG: DUF2141 domain-containing protein [Bacteroidales bacterium]|nr:DUF2141 domain-containing protein [Bacteroidales bacterium]
MIRKITSSLLFIIIIIPTYSQKAGHGTLAIKFTGMQNNVGAIAIGINSSDQGWPRKPQLEFRWKKTNSNEGILMAAIEDLPFGTYAISALDDENGNLEMDMILGVPREGFGFSNNPPIRFKTPSYESCAFKFEQPHMEIIIELNYMGKE